MSWGINPPLRVLPQIPSRTFAVGPREREPFLRVTPRC